MRLNLIGNGFDLYHGLPSKYRHFAFFLIDKHESFYYEMGTMYGVQTISAKNIGPYIEETPVVKDQFWSDFESNLGQLEDCWLEYSLPDELDLENDDAVQIDMPEVFNARIIKNYFSEWVKEYLDSSENIEIIDRHKALKMVDFGDDDLFITFNYTHLLENLYGIYDSQIEHIHGEANDPESIVVGHGNVKEIQDKKVDLKEYEEKYNRYNQHDLNRYSEIEAEIQVLESLKKDVDYYKLRIGNFLHNQDIDEIYVYGLSCNDIDAPYYKELIKLYPYASWHFSSYDGKEAKNREKFAEKVLKLKKGQYDTFKFRNKNADIICDDIMKSRGFKTYPVI